jgi:hypothetical protein
MTKLPVACRNSANTPNDNRLTKITCKRSEPCATDDIQQPRDPNFTTASCKIQSSPAQVATSGEAVNSKSTAATEHAIHTLHNQPSTAMLVKNPSIFGTPHILVTRDELL